MSSVARLQSSRSRRSRRAKAEQEGVRLRDVAVLAGVSTASVSRALNTPATVSEATLSAVQAAAMRLGYTPNSAARALRTRRARAIGAVVPTIANSIFSPGIEAIGAVLEDAGYSLLLATSDYDPALELRRVTTLVERGVDGLILVGRWHAPELRSLLVGRGVPYVCQGAYEPDGPHPCVGFDNAAAMAPVVDHLLALGHRRIAMLAGVAAGNDRVTDRVGAVRAGLAARGLELTGLVEARYELAAARAGTRRLLDVRPRPTAIVCVNDVLALGALFEARGLGLGVPDDLSITGFDDFDFARNVEPPLTTVRVPVEAMGRGAAEHLLARLAGQSAPHATLLPTELVVRRSSATASERRGG